MRTMRALVLSAWPCVFLGTIGDAGLVGGSKLEEDFSDEAFWDRFLAVNNIGSYPSQAPVITSAPSTGPGCVVEVGIDCHTAEGGTCENLPLRSTECPSGDLTSIKFIFSVLSCSEDHNQQEGLASCSDLGTYSGGYAVISCTDVAGNEMIVSPVSVSPEQEFLVESPGGGPISGGLCCLLHNDNGDPFQTSCFDTSANAILGLGDEFGSMTVASCNGISCREELELEFTIANPDAAETSSIISLTEYIDNVPASLLDRLNSTTLEPGQSTAVSERILVDTCAPYQHQVSIVVDTTEASTGQSCSADDSLTITVGPSPSSSPGTLAPSSSFTTPPPTLESALQPEQAQMEPSSAGSQGRGLEALALLFMTFIIFN